MAQKVFVGVGHQSVCLISPDGIQWKQVNSGKPGQILRSVSIGDGRCVAIGMAGGSNVTAVSEDGAKWQMGEKDAGYSRYAGFLMHDSGKFIGYGGDGASLGDAKPYALVTTDGVKWSDYLAISGGWMLRRIAVGEGKFVGVGDRGRLAVSPDGIHDWKDVPNVKPVDTYITIAYGNGIFVAGGLHGSRTTTKDGIKWTEKQHGEEGEHLNSVLWTGEQFVAVGMGGTYFSPDGLQWKRVPNKNAPQTATYGNGIYVGTHWKGRLLYSTDAIEWKEVFNCEHHINDIAYGSIG